MDEGALWRVAGIYGDEVAGVRSVRGRALEALRACWALNEHWLPFAEVVKPFEGVDTTQGDPLHCFASSARVGHIGEQPGEELHPVSKAGWLARRGLPAARN